tara:strand:+ start:7657 stop:7818 length:162 start_codon:yes stop_codon:yes gene_type:complete
VGARGSEEREGELSSLSRDGSDNRRRIRTWWEIASNDALPIITGALHDDDRAI